jgi:lipoteichoic acid synthase
VARLVWLDPDDVFTNPARRSDVVAVVGLVPYHVRDAAIHLTHVLAGPRAVSAADRARVVAFLEARPAAPGPVTGWGSMRGQNVIMVMAESLHAFPLGLALDGQPVAPNLDALASESWRFDRFYDQTHEGTTSDGEFTSLQSLHPLSAAAVATRYPLNRLQALPTVLRDRGYLTISAAGEMADMWNKRQVHPRLGFARSFFLDAFPPGEWIGAGLADGIFLDAMAARLERLDQPFLAFLITASNHHPFVLPPSHRRLRLGPLAGTLVGNYLDSVHHADAALGAFVRRLRATGLLDRSILLVYGDHRAFLGTPPELMALLGLPDNAFHRWDVARRLTCLLRLPGGVGARARTMPTGHLDLAPTVLDLLGIPPPATMLGTSLLGPGPRTVIFRGGDLVADDRVLLSGRSGGHDTCWDAATARPTDCAPLGQIQRRAREQVTVSDILISGDLIAALR